MSAASSAARPAAEQTRPSAGTLSPVVSRTRSPSTSSRAATSISPPARTTVAVGAASSRSASSARSARYSCTKPSSAAKTTITEITIASVRWPSTAESPAPTSRIRISTFLNCSSTSLHGEIPAAASISFGPSTASRRAVSASSSPTTAEVRSAAATSSTARACHSTARPGAGATTVTASLSAGATVVPDMVLLRLVPAEGLSRPLGSRESGPWPCCRRRAAGILPFAPSLIRRPPIRRVGVGAGCRPRQTTDRVARRRRRRAKMRGHRDPQRSRAAIVFIRGAYDVLELGQWEFRVVPARVVRLPRPPRLTTASLGRARRCHRGGFR